MRMPLRVGLVGIVIVASALAVAMVVTSPEFGSTSRGVSHRKALDRAPGSVPPARNASETSGPAPAIPLFSAGFVDDSGYTLAFQHTPPIQDRSSLAEIRAAVRVRGRRGLETLQQELAQLELSAPGVPGRASERCRLQTLIGLLHMYEGEFEQAAPWFEKAATENAGLPARLRANTAALLGIAAMRKGEVENCVACLGPSSCIFPIASEAVHQLPSGSREAIRQFTAYLKEQPEDLGVRWLLNIAYMTLGEYPHKVPREYLIALEPFRSQIKIGQFVNIAPSVGLDTRGPNMLGGSVFDDFTGDGLPDIFVASTDVDLGSSLFVNKGDGTFEDRGTQAGLSEQTLVSNVSHADFDNDGWLDVLLLRGGWENPYRLTLLRNKGEGVFEDVTVASGLGEPIASQSAAWGDFDNDGFVDVYVVGEHHGRSSDGPNRCRLYRNQGNGTFVDVAAQAGVTNQRWAKGAAWGDYDGDGFIDLYVSNMNAHNRLYHNNGDGTFRDVAADLGVAEPMGSFACWFWDYDNDGRLDLYVNAFHAWLNDVVADYLGKPASGERPRLYRNFGPDGFYNVTEEAGLDRVLLPMGSNFADIDNDGFLDIYLGTGKPPYSHLVPNVMLKNVGGRRFEDVTLATGTGHLQKGHGVSFADFDGDGDLDLFVETGGSTPGDRAHNVLFQNPGNGNHWLKVKLVGTKTNRAAIGAQIRVDLAQSDGLTASIYRTIGSGSSFGGNSLVATIGLGDSRTVKDLTLTWPVSKSRQILHDIEADQAIEITEEADAYRILELHRLHGPSAR